MSDDLWLEEKLDEALEERDALRSRVAKLEAALRWYAADGDNAEFRIVDRNGEFVANFGSFSSRALAALKDAPQ